MHKSKIKNLISFSNMLLAIDIGNTNINCGLFCGNAIMKRFFIPTGAYSQERLRSALHKNRIKECEVILCSVVPSVTRVLGRDIRMVLGKSPHIVGQDLPVPIKNLYRHPKKVGSDRLVNAFAGIKRYGAPLIVVDFGTAVTFDVISRNKEYRGGMILPGLNISLDALSARTALLPRIKLARPAEFIGRDTKNSILSGLVYGFAALTDHLIEKIKGKIGQGALAIGTGGDIDLVCRYCRNLDAIDKDLTLEGLGFLYHK